MTSEKRFWSKVKLTDKCFEWVASKNKQGYGRFSYHGKFIAAHRFSYIIHYGGTVKELLVLHRCDNTSCVRPDHLFLGTQKDNMADSISKNRQPKGETHGIHKLTDNQVKTIKELWDKRICTRKQLEEIFNIAETTIYNITTGVTWRHVSL